MNVNTTMFCMRLCETCGTFGILHTNWSSTQNVLHIVQYSPEQIFPSPVRSIVDTRVVVFQTASPH
ncbi:unnamed protein product [Sphacelaria rigidula]